MKSKRTATAKNIDAINRYLQNVADIWTIYSNEYEKATAKVKDFDIRTNKNGVIQIKNTKANRKKHQKIRAIKNTTKSKNIIQRNYNKRTKGLTKKDINAIKTFEDDVSNAYKKLKELQEKYELDITQYLDRLRNGDTPSSIINDAMLESEIQQMNDVPDFENKNTIETDNGVIDADTGELINSYVVNYLINGKCIDKLLYMELIYAINDSCYYFKTLSYKADQAQIYKNGILIAELNK